ncbi:MAG: restriction endonuclease subunit S [Streptococcus sp.]|uniref:restriction endonuclease subunit S n=1 Tax=Streptococcus sp. TaxID=1306 RepID=UPI0029036B94|nr:restriction endonuclease subunit S [Streptococcus sp.]MDU2587770.1 restriction endonuclease subunit S [Streptococcus sp.]
MKAILPKIKFKNFYEKWNRKKLQSIAPLRGGFAFKSEKFLDSGIPIVRISNIKFDGTVGGEFEYYSKINSDEKFVLRGRSILLAMSGATTGKIAMLDSEEEYYQNQRVGYFQNTGAVNYDFLSSVLQTKEFTNQLNSVLVAGAQPNISSKEIDSFVFYIPESLDEQSAIGSLFHTIDDLMVSYKENLANYQSLKATMLSKMFPKAGQTVPEIRLDGFEGEWEKVKLKDVTESIEYGLNASAKEFDGENKYIRITDIDDVSRKFKEDSITSPDINVSECDNYLLCEKDILFARTGASVGKTYLYDIKDGKVYFAGFLIRARIKEKFDSKFIFQNTLTDRFTQYVKVTSQRSGQPGVNGKEYGEYELYIPKYEEQQAIGSYFSNLDNLINSHQEKISQLETLKKKLLQDMFI